MAASFLLFPDPPKDHFAKQISACCLGICACPGCLGL